MPVKISILQQRNLRYQDKINKSKTLNAILKWIQSRINVINKFDILQLNFFKNQNTPNHAIQFTHKRTARIYTSVIYWYIYRSNTPQVDFNKSSRIVVSSLYCILESYEQQCNRSHRMLSIQLSCNVRICNI